MPASHRMTMLRARAEKLRDTIALKQKEYEKISRRYEAELAEAESLFGNSDINEIEKICVENSEDIKISMKYFDNTMDKAKLILNITDQ